MTHKDDKHFDQRLDAALKKSHLEISEEGNVVPDDDTVNATSGLGYGMRIGIEFMAGTVVGMAMGWGIDSYFNTLPWFLLLFTILGFGAGIMNVYRSINNMDDSIGLNRQNLGQNGLTKDGKTNISKPTN